MEVNYTAFGLKIAGISSKKLGDVNEGSIDNKNLYNDKELWDDGDLNWYDYGYRNYDPQIGRFPQLDPLTDYYPDLTNYQYASNEPIGNIDMDGLEKIVSTAGSLTSHVTQAAPTFVHITTTALKDATHFTPLLKLTSIIPQVAKVAGNITKSSIENNFKRPPTRVGFDWQGKGADPLPVQIHKAPKNEGYAKALEIGAKVTENGEYLNKLIQNNNLAKKFEFGNTILTGASLINNLSNNDSKGAFFDAVDLGMSQTPLAPYYYGAKTIYQIYDSDVMQSAGYQQALEDERNAAYYMRQYKEGDFGYKVWERQLKQASRSIKEYQARWARTHLPKPE